MAELTHKKTHKTQPTTILEQEDNFFIPDLCKVNAILFLLILTQLLSFILCLVNTSSKLIDWESLGLLSIFCHFIALSFSALICVTRDKIKNKSHHFIILYFITTNLVVTWLYSWVGSTLLFPNLLQEAQLFTLKSILISGTISALVLRYFFLQSQWKEQKQAELKSRIQALQARIRPHFLFNSMNSIASLISIDPLKAEEVVLDLSSLFRATLNNQSSLIAFEEEISLCRQYLNIESLRLGERLKVKWEVDLPERKIKIPPLTLQPLFENAIYHGIQPRKEGGTIEVKANYKDDVLYILISNPYDESLQKHKGNHIALDNIQSRLVAIFGDSAILKTSQLNNTFTVTLRFPITE